MGMSYRTIVKRQEALRPEAEEMRRCGYSFRQISDACGISLRTAWCWTHQVEPDDLELPDR